MWTFYSFIMLPCGLVCQSQPDVRSDSVDTMSSNPDKCAMARQNMPILAEKISAPPRIMERTRGAGIPQCPRIDSALDLTRQHEVENMVLNTPTLMGALQSVGRSRCVPGEIVLRSVEHDFTNR